MQHRLLHRTIEDEFRMVEQMAVQRIIAGDHHHQSIPVAAPRASRLLPERSQGAREPGHHHRIQPGDVDAQLQGIGRSHPGKLSRPQPGFQLPAITRQIA